jgi:hypothetical protein
VLISRVTAEGIADGSVKLRELGLPRSLEGGYEISPAGAPSSAEASGRIGA